MSSSPVLMKPKLVDHVSYLECSLLPNHAIVDLQAELTIRSFPTIRKKDVCACMPTLQGKAGRRPTYTCERNAAAG